MSQIHKKILTSDAAAEEFLADVGSATPNNGQIGMDGGTNINTTASGSTVTFNLDSSIDGLTQVSSELFTAPAGNPMELTAATGENIEIRMGDAAGANQITFMTSASGILGNLNSNGQLTTPSIVTPSITSKSSSDLDINGASGQDIVVKMGDAAGSNKVSFTDSADAEVSSLDSDGNFSIVGYISIGMPRYATLKDLKSSGTNGGSSSIGSWITRDLNDEDDPDGIVTLSANEFTLGAGTYWIYATAPFSNSLQTKIKLTADPSGTPADIIIGESVYCSTFVAYIDATLMGIITPASSTTYAIQYQVARAYSGGFGLGIASGFGVSEVYTQVFIQKLSD